MKLRDYLSDNACSHANFAEKVGVTQAAISRYSNGKRMPLPKIVDRIQMVTQGLVTWSDHYAAFQESNSNSQTADASGSGIDGLPAPACPGSSGHQAPNTSS